MNGKINNKKTLNSLGIFTSVHLMSLIFSVLRTKLAAVWLGSFGVGILGLLLSSFHLIMSIVNAGLPLTIVRNLAGESHESLGQKLTISQIILIITGILGSLSVFVFSNQLSLLTFKNSEFTWAFRLISFSIFMKQLAIGYASILQSQSKIVLYANANLIGNFIGVIMTLPLYYYFGIRGLVYNFICVAIVESVVFYIAYKKARFKERNVSWDFFKNYSSLTIKEGFIFSLSSFFTLLVIYLLQIFISNQSNIYTLGIYIAGFTIINSYVSMIFNIMSIDYFPRLTEKKLYTTAFNDEVNSQFYIGILLITPLLLLMIILAPYVVKVLFNVQFLDSVEYIYGALLGVYFKIFSWTIGFVITSKGSKKMIIYNSIFYNSIFLIIHIIGFYYWKLIGAALAYSIYYLIHLIGNYFITKSFYSIQITQKNLSLFFLNLLILISALLIIIYVSNYLIQFILIGFIFLIILFYSLNKLRHLYKN